MPEAPQRGRPRLSPEDVKARVQEYCRRYAVHVGPAGLPPFPTGKRETAQHRDWMAVYKARQRLGRVGGASLEARRGVLEAQHGVCALCGGELGVAVAVVQNAPDGRASALHPACQRLAVAAEAAGPEAVAGLRAYLSQAAAHSPRRRT